MRHIEGRGGRRALMMLLATLGLGGCMVGPVYRPPTTRVAPGFTAAAANGTDEAALSRWWTNYGDTRLEQLVARGIAHNYDLRIAEANLRQARALYRLARFDRLPTVRSGAAYSTQLQSSAAAPSGATHDQRQGELFDAGFDATWELDFFGRVRHSVAAASAELDASEARRLDVLVSLTAEIARSYFEMLGLEEQLAVARRNVAVQSQTETITKARMDGGRGTAFDVARSSALLNLTASTIPTLEAAARKTRHRLAVLVGEPPAALLDTLEPATALPWGLKLPTLGDPAALLRRRPDIRAAERELGGATARIGVATADLFPRVLFVGSIGLQADSFGDVGGGGSSNWQFGPHLTWAAFDLGRVRARIAAATDQADAALANYERSVLVALQETEDALVDFGQEQHRARALQTSAAASQQAVELAHQRYAAGVADFLSVLDAERSLLEAQDRLAVSRTRTATALVAVYKALGGGVPVAEASVDGAPD